MCRSPLLISSFMILYVWHCKLIAPKKYAKEKPTIEAIFKAAKSLKLNPKLEKDCAYPSTHWKKQGRILVDKKESKGKLLKQIANRM